MAMDKFIKIRGARVNNLKDINLDLPINKLICFFGPSGSGKTSIAFHTLYSESKRRFLNSFPTYLKFFSDRPSPVDVDSITPVLPVFGLPQNNPVVGSRSNVADIMHLTELFQNLYYHYGEELCPEHGVHFIEESFEDHLSDHINSELSPSEIQHILIRKNDFLDYFSNTPFPTRSLAEATSTKMTPFEDSDEYWEVARFKTGKIVGLNKKLEIYIKQGVDLFLFEPANEKLEIVNFHLGKLRCSMKPCDSLGLNGKSPLHFSPYNALGACHNCGGFGETLAYDEKKLWDESLSVAQSGVLLLNYKRFGSQIDELILEMKKKKISTTKPIKELDQTFFDLLYMGSGDYIGFNEFFTYLERRKYKMNVRIFIRNIQIGRICDECYGTRLGAHSEQFFLENFSNHSLSDLVKQDISEVSYFLQELKMNTKEGRKALLKINKILKTAIGIGLGHLNLLRKAKTLSAGEYQRLLLLKYLSYEGMGSLFIFDEPSLGLSLKECRELQKGFQKLIESSNTVVLIDHNKYFRESSDYIVEMGIGSGNLGGEVIFEGDQCDYEYQPIFHNLKPYIYSDRKFIKVHKPTIYNKDFASFELPLDEIVWVSGGSGSGKSACLVNTLANYLHHQTHGKFLKVERGEADAIECDILFDDVIVVDANLTRYTSRSSVGSLTDFFTVLRKHYSRTTMAKSLGLKDGHFSYNSDLGQCPKCEGRGVTTVEMQFLEDIVLECEDCKGKRLKPIYAGITDGHKTVHEAFSMPICDVLSGIKLTPKFQRLYEYIKILNLDYLSFNRSINSLSGGEKQRIYLLSKLQKNISNSILFFENISFGLSEKELINVCDFLQALSKKNNTIIIIDQDEFFENIASYRLKFT
jgi:excinuclease ABC subunit A